MIKKMMLLAGMALAATALAVPASASALEWTDEGAPFTGTITESITGQIDFGNPAPGQTKFGCVIHAEVDLFGGTTTGELTSFEPTTESCSGQGAFAGCSLVEDETTLPRNALGTSEVTFNAVGTNEITVKTPAGEPIVLHSVYSEGCPIEKSTLTVEDITLKGTNSNLTALTVSGMGVSHTWVGGVQQPPQNVAFFTPAGLPMGTTTDTIGIS